MRYLFFLCLVGALVYTMLLVGVYRKSKYSLLGAVRASCQRISFEVIFFFILFCFIGVLKRFTIFYNFNILLILILPVLVCIVIVELNRPPFDFREGESELVRGFNLEMGGYLFVLLFLREYGFMLFFCYFISLLIFAGSWFMFLIFFVFILSVRRRFPRYRYDKLMEFFWFKILPFVMFMFLRTYLVFLLNYIIIKYFLLSIRGFRFRSFYYIP